MTQDFNFREFVENNIKILQEQSTASLTRAAFLKELLEMFEANGLRVVQDIPEPEVTTVEEKKSK